MVKIVRLACFVTRERLFFVRIGRGTFRVRNPRCLLLTWLFLTSLTSVFAQAVIYQAIPPGYDFPADESALLKMQGNGDLSGMRKHAWMVFAGLTQKTPAGEAIWETWYSGRNTFASGLTIEGARKIERPFQNPRQFLGASQRLGIEDVGASLLSFTLFNKETRDFVQQNRFYSKSQLSLLNNAFPPHTPAPQRQISSAPRPAVSLKTVWWIVKQTGLTPIPVWDSQLNPQLPKGNDYPTWKRVVAVDPSRTEIPSSETTNVDFDGPKLNSHVVPLNHFYGFQITANEIDSVRASKAPFANKAQIGDYAVLVAMHYTTKEIPQWVWATFWWHDKPNDGSFGADRPDQVVGVWRNYLMSTTYGMDTPNEKDGSPPIAFNPWLEARFPNGVLSNCMACHQKAVWPSQSFLPVVRGTMNPEDPYFKDEMKLDFLWSIAFESH